MFCKLKLAGYISCLIGVLQRRTSLSDLVNYSLSSTACTSTRITECTACHTKNKYYSFSVTVFFVIQSNQYFLRFKV